MPTPPQVDFIHAVVRVSTIRPPRCFDEFANPTHSALSNADVAGMTPSDIGYMVRDATYRMPVETHVVVGSFLPGAYP